MNYRMGVFGFLGHEVLRSRNDDGSVGNYGLQDQQLALQWVQVTQQCFMTCISLESTLLRPCSTALASRATLQPLVVTPR
jgi:hypothetical protein